MSCRQEEQTGMESDGETEKREGNEEAEQREAAADTEMEEIKTQI